MATDDRFAPPDQVAAFEASAASASAGAEVHRYSGVGHFYTDATLPDDDRAAAATTWGHVMALITASGAQDRSAERHHSP